MNVTIITPPPFEPVSLAEVYVSLRLDPEGSPGTHPDDSALRRHIAAARQDVEAMTRRSLVRQTIRLSVADFPPVSQSRSAGTGPASRRTAVREIRLVRPPFIVLNSVRYYDAGNALVTVDPANYYVTDEQVPELRFITGFSLPEVYDRRDAVRIEYDAGYIGNGSPPASQEEYAANVPAALKDAILLGVQLRYDSLTPADRRAISDSIEAIVQPLRIQHAL